MKEFIVLLAMMCNEGENLEKAKCNYLTERHYRIQTINSFEKFQYHNCKDADEDKTCSVKVFEGCKFYFAGIEEPFYSGYICPN